MSVTPLIRDGDLSLYIGDALTVMRELPESSVNCVVTSPPYWKQRNYDNVPGQIGQERTPHLYAEHLAVVFSEAWRVLREDGALWLNVGDKYLSKELLGIPWLVANALKADGWILRNEVIWHKTNVRPESAKDRLTHSHEQLFFFTRAKKYWFDREAIVEPAKWERWGDQTVTKYEGTSTATGWMKPKTKVELQQRTTRNKRDVWSIPTANYKGAHDAVYPEALIEPCILATCPADGTVLDPFIGSGTTAIVALRHGRNVIGIDLNKRAAKQTSARVGRANTGRV